MTVNELKKQLESLIENGKGDMDIIMSKDEEGNGFNTLYEVQVSPCVDEEPIHPDDIETEDIDINDVTYSVVFWA